jgi:glycolate oxidase FAD binding subunit
MPRLIAPKSAAELASLIANATEPMRLQGLGSKPTLGNPVDASTVLSLAKFSGIENYEPEELILEAGAATKLSDIEKLLQKHGQMLAFEPPDWSKHFATATSGTLGGVIASGLSGPRRIKSGSARDHVLGFAGVSGAGDILKAGARVVKNVTGYDLPKLVTGSYGSLVAMTTIIVKVVPRPETEATLVVKGLDDADAIRLMSQAMQSSAEVSAAAHIPGKGTYLRLDGIAPSVDYRRDQLAKHLGLATHTMNEKESATFWCSIRDAKPFAPLKGHALWRISVTPSEAAAVAGRILSTLGGHHFYDWAGGLIWLAVDGMEDGGAARIRGSLTSGHATLIRATEDIRQTVGAFHPQGQALAALAKRVKQSFDPNGILNPGIMAKS